MVTQPPLAGASRWAIVGAFLLIMALPLALSYCSKAWSHDFWINNNGYRAPTGEHCCGDKDCESFKEGEVHRVKGGYFIDALKEFVPDAEAQLGEDAFFWRCKRTDGSRRCFFTPTSGV